MLNGIPLGKILKLVKTYNPSYLDTDNINNIFSTTFHSVALSQRFWILTTMYADIADAELPVLYKKGKSDQFSVVWDERDLTEWFFLAWWTIFDEAWLCDCDCINWTFRAVRL